MTAESTITDLVAEMHAATAAEPPNEVMAAFGREQAELAASGVPAGVAAAGSEIPDADLLDVHGSPTTLYAATEGGAAVLVFYRGVWCPYCNIALSAYQRHLLPQLAERGIRLVAIESAAPGRVAVHAAAAQPVLHGGVRPRQRARPGAGDPDPAVV